MRYFLTFFIVLALFFITVFVPSLNLFASETIRTSYLITDTKTFSSPSTLYHSSSVTFPWQSGKVVIAGNPEGTANADVGIDMAILSSGSTIFTFKGACSSSVATEIPMPPLDITHMVTAPSRTLKFDFRKPTSSCVPSSITIGPVYLVHFSDAHYKASTFLGLPFDYTKKVDGTSSGLSFEQAALSMDTFFDHNAPLRTLNEEGSGAPITSYENYLGQTITSPYSGFEGYGWGEKAGVSAGTTVIAAASGKAYYENSEFCGEMVYINHSVLSVDNSTTLNFQTRYCQINPLPDIKNLPPQGFKIVSQSDPIGTVSLQPTLTAKPQLYFVVIFDKDNDLQFNDNLSDGVIDPFKTYLFQTTIPNLKRNYLAATNNNFSVGTTTFNFLGNLYRDSNFVFRDTFLTFKSAPRNTVFIESSTQKKLHSASTVIVIEKNDEFGNSIETFAPGSNKYFTMNMAYSPSIASNFIPNSLALYYSKDGLNWIKESSSAYTISSNSVSANINHLTQFAILGEVADSQPPSTTILVNNQAPLTNYSEPVTFTLQNNEGSQSNTIFYKINTGSFLKYQSPVTLSASQTYVIYFFSEDSNNNVEALNSKTFTIQIPTPTPTLTPTPTNTPTPTSINTETLTSTPTPTLTPTPTNTSIITLTPTLSITPTPTISITLASVLTITNTPYPTNTIANTQTPTSTLTPLPTITPTKSPIGKLKHKANTGNDLNIKTVPENEKNNNDVLTVTKSVNIKGESSSDRSIFSITIPILTILSLLLLTYYLLIFKKKQK